jgi:hypothetical protein
MFYCLPLNNSGGVMRATTILLVTILATAASGCMTNTKSDGGKTFTYDCSGLGKGWGDCTAKADAQCGARNYTIISQTGAADEKGASGNTEMKRTLVVSCK